MRGIRHGAIRHDFEKACFVDRVSCWSRVTNRFPELLTMLPLPGMGFRMWIWIVIYRSWLLSYVIIVTLNRKKFSLQKNSFLLVYGNRRKGKKGRKNIFWIRNTIGIEAFYIFTRGNVCFLLYSLKYNEYQWDNKYFLFIMNNSG